MFEALTITTSGEIDGKAICYCINPDTLKKMEHFISEIFRKIEKQKSCC
jgi:hypothetical protein